jgi:hypothetical protein
LHPEAHERTGNFSAALVLDAGAVPPFQFAESDQLGMPVAAESAPVHWNVVADAADAAPAGAPARPPASNPARTTAPETAPRLNPFSFIKPLTPSFRV